MRVRLATPGGKTPPLDFLDKHDVTITSASAPSKCTDALAAGKATPVKRGADGVYEVSASSERVGEICFEAHMTPGPNGVLTRLGLRGHCPGTSLMGRQTRSFWIRFCAS